MRKRKRWGFFLGWKEKAGRDERKRRKIGGGFVFEKETREV